MRKVYTTIVFPCPCTQLHQVLRFILFKWSRRRLCDLARQVQIRGEDMVSRKRHFLGILFLAVSAYAQTGETRKPAKDSLTGCVDERDGQYVLTNDTNL